MLPGFPVILETPVRWFLEFKNQMRSAGSARQVRNLVFVVKWSKNHLPGISSLTGDPSNKSVKASIEYLSLKPYKDECGVFGQNTGKCAHRGGVKPRNAR